MGVRTVRLRAVWLYLCLYIYIYYSVAGHQRTADTPAGGGRADTPAGGRQAGIPAGATILRMGIHAYATGKGGYGGSPNVETGNIYQHPPR
jgi:hypothetical protein